MVLWSNSHLCCPEIYNLIYRSATASRFICKILYRYTSSLDQQSQVSNSGDMTQQRQPGLSLGMSQQERPGKSTRKSSQMCLSVCLGSALVAVSVDISWSSQKQQEMAVHHQKVFCVFVKVFAKVFMKVWVCFSLWSPDTWSSTTQCKADQDMCVFSKESFFTCPFVSLLQQNIISLVYASPRRSFTSLP